LATHGPGLHRLLARLTLREDVAEDLLQELFLKLRDSAGFRRADHPAAYARRAAVHLAFDWHRRNDRRPPQAPLPEELPGQEPSGLDALVRREELGGVVRCLGELPEASRDCLVLHYLEQEPYEEIARALGKTPHQVRALCHKGIARLRLLLGAGAAAGEKGEFS